MSGKKKRFIQSFVQFSAMQAENQCASQEAACEHIMLERVYCFYALSLLSVSIGIYQTLARSFRGENLLFVSLISRSLLWILFSSKRVFSIFKNNGICHKNYPKLAFDSSTIEKKCHINLSIGAWEHKFSRVLERHLSRCRAAPLRGRDRVEKKNYKWDWMSNSSVTYVAMRQKLEILAQEYCNTKKWNLKKRHKLLQLRISRFWLRSTYNNLPVI